MGIEIFKHIYFRLPVLVRLLLTILFVMSSFGILIHFIEPNQFPTIFDGIWWAFVTGATVGYGDYVPLSITGRVIGILLILTGAGLLTFYISIFAATTVKHERDLSKGKVAFMGNNHIIFVGWNEQTRQLIDLTLKDHPKIELVLLDHTLAHLSYQHYPIHFIHGDATDDFSLRQANINDAVKVVISADMSKKERQADHDTILSTVAVRGNNKHIPIIAEILSAKQVDNAMRAGASTVVRPNDFMSVLLYHELFRNEHANPFENIINLLSQQQFIQFTLPEKMANTSFLSIVNHYKQKEYLIIGFIRNNEWKLNPPAELQLSKDDTLIAIIDWQS